MLQLMLDIEVGRVVKDGHDLAIGGSSTSGRAIRGVSHGTVWRDRDGIERHWLLWVLCDVGHIGVVSEGDGNLVRRGLCFGVVGEVDVEGRRS